MAVARIWFINNDMAVSLSGLQTSTMAVGAYLNNSANVQFSVWKSATTQASTNQILTNVNMPYLSGTNGNYRYVAQSTGTTALAAYGVSGMAIITVHHQGLDGEWRVPFQTQYRQTS